MTPETEKRLLDLVEWLIKESSMATIKRHHELVRYLLGLIA